MIGSQVDDQCSQQLGETWIRALTAKDFQRLTGICHPEVQSRLMTPWRVSTLEKVSDLTQKVEGWFGECYAIQKEQARVEKVGEKLAIFYRLRLEEDGAPYTIEQQLYCTLREGRIDQLSLLCSGFQPDQSPIEAPLPQAVSEAASVELLTAQAHQQADALLEVTTAGERESTCSILTPMIKHKLGGLNSGQVLEVRVDDPDAKGDIEAWCRLSGNPLLKMEQGAGQELRFYLMKK